MGPAASKLCQHIRIGDKNLLLLMVNRRPDGYGLSDDWQLRRYSTAVAWAIEQSQAHTARAIFKFAKSLNFCKLLALCRAPVDGLLAS